jgi:AcrR family transcriptional regulator
MTTTSVRRARNRKGEGGRLRQEILTAAAALLADLGDADALTIRAVAAASSVTSPAVYQHFPDKAALLRALLEREFEGFQRRLVEAEAGADDACEALRRRCYAYVRFGEEKPGAYRVLLSARELGPKALALGAEQPHPGAGVLNDLFVSVERCRLARGFAASETSLVALQLWTSLHGMVDLRISKPEIDWPPAERMVDASLGQLQLAEPDPDAGRENADKRA